MPVTALDERTALVVIEIQRSVIGRATSTARGAFERGHNLTFASDTMTDLR